MGTFKQGKENGQQRLIQSYPIKQRYFTQFTSHKGELEGPALIERADGRVEVGNYLGDKQDGQWRYKYINGTQDTITFQDGKQIKKESNTEEQ